MSLDFPQKLEQAKAQLVQLESGIQQASNDIVQLRRECTSLENETASLKTKLQLTKEGEGGLCLLQCELEDWEALKEVNKKKCETSLALVAELKVIFLPTSTQYLFFASKSNFRTV